MPRFADWFLCATSKPSTDYADSFNHSAQSVDGFEVAQRRHECFIIATLSHDSSTEDLNVHDIKPG